MKIIKKLAEIILIIIFAVFAAINYIIFVFPNSFAPSGVDGICTMIQDVLNINMGYLSLVINIPLLICAFFVLNHDFSIKNAVYVLVFSTSVILLKNSPLSEFCYYTETGTSIVLAPIAAGVIRGILYTLTLKLNGSSGGIDIIAAIIKKKKPYLELMNVIFILNMLIALCSYFVYGMKLEPVICSIIYAFITSSITKHIQSSSIETVKYEIITPDASKLCDEITGTLNLSATIMEAQGAYSGQSKKVVICVVKKHITPQLDTIIQNYKDSVTFKSIIKG